MEPEEANPNEFHFTDPRQKRIYKRLQLIGPGPASFYHDACILMATKYPFDTSTHLVSHLLREIESSLCAVLEHVGNHSKHKEIKGTNKHEQKILTILKNLEIQEDDPVVQGWLNLARRHEEFSLAKRAHREALEKPRPLDDNFRTFWNEMEDVLDYVLEKFESRFVQLFEVLDELLTKEKPTDKDIKTLRNNIPNNYVTLGYFFDKLTHSLWLEPLKEDGFFRHPPEPERADEKGSIRYPPWPQSRYLVRMAQVEPEKVMEIILEIPETANYIIHADIADAALELNPDLSVKIIPKVKSWTGSTNQSLLFDRISKLIIHLARGGFVDQAFDLTREVLKVSRIGGKSEESIYFGREGLKSHFDAWHYEQIIKKILPRLVELAEDEVLSLFCDMLEEVIGITDYPRSEDGLEDNSYSWRPAIVDSDQNTPNDILNLLVWAVRETSEVLITKKGKTVLGLVEGRPFRVFHRIGLHLRRKFPNVDPDGTAKLIVDPSVFDERHFHHEYFHLVKESFNRLPREIQDAYLALVEQKSGREQFRKLWPIQKFLNPEWKRRFEELKEKFGELDHPDFYSYVFGTAGFKSPLNAEDLSRMEINEIVTFLKGWEQPSDEFFGPTPEGLGRELARVVALDPPAFAMDASQFRELDPTYIRSLLSAFEKAIKEKISLPWESIIDLCQWVLEQPRDIPGRDVERFESDPDWGETRKQIAYLISEGFEVEKGIPYNLREEVWNVLKPLTDDPDPSPRDESAPNMSPTLLSINSTRGMAIQATGLYIIWIRNHIREIDEKRLKNGLDEMPEAREVLEKHLDLEEDPSLAIHSVYGKLFPWFVVFDREWITQNMEKIFPQRNSLKEFCDAAWEGYVTYCGPYDGPLELLKSEYQKALDNIREKTTEEPHRIDPNKRIAEHIMTYYWRGKLDLEDVESLISEFFEMAPAPFRFHALNFIGHSLHETGGDVEPQFLDRLKKLWVWRVKVAQEAESIEPYIEEQKAFGWWFASDKFDDEWAVEYLKKCLEIAGHIEIDHLVVEGLAKLSETMPLIAVECLSLLVGGLKEGWRVHFWEKQARILLSEVLQGTDTEAKKSAKELISRLVARGYTDFKDLL